mgnify:CR=1 FL=1
MKNMKKLVSLLLAVCLMASLAIGCLLYTSDAADEL